LTARWVAKNSAKTIARDGSVVRRLQIIETAELNPFGAPTLNFFVNFFSPGAFN